LQSGVCNNASQNFVFRKPPGKGSRRPLRHQWLTVKSATWFRRLGGHESRTTAL